MVYYTLSIYTLGDQTQIYNHEYKIYYFVDSNFSYSKFFCNVQNTLNNIVNK